MRTRRGLGLVLACAGAIVSTHLRPQSRSRLSASASAISISFISFSNGQARSSFPWNVSCFGVGGSRDNLHLFLSLSLPLSLSLFSVFLSSSLFPLSRRAGMCGQCVSGTW